MAITVEGIGKSYGAKRVLETFSCRFEEGTVTCIMGQSGQGKTTLLRILMGLEQADSGLISGMEGKRLSAVFQEDRLCDNLSAAANIRLVCPKTITQEVIMGALTALNLPPESAKQSAGSMSGGQRRRVAILRALLADYDILLMDEPFKGLDKDTKENVMAYTQGRIEGKTTIFVTHDKSECDRLGGRLIVL